MRLGSAHSIGIDLGGTRIKVVAVDESGGILKQSKCKTTGGPGEEKTDATGGWVEEILFRINEFEKHLGETGYTGVAAPGLAERNHRQIVCMPGRLEGLEGLDWSKALGRQAPVPVLNDAHAALLGEAWIGAAKGSKNVILLTLGTGVGGAILSEGRLLLGESGRAGHLGHICLDPNGERDVTGIPGSLEDAIGECTLEKRSEGRFSQTEDLIRALSEGDPRAAEIWLKSVKALACGISSLVNVLDPEAVILAGGISEAGEALLSPLKEFLNEVEWRPLGSSVKLCLAELGDHAGAVGAARFAIDFS